MIIVFKFIWIIFCELSVDKKILGNLSKPRRQRQRERRQTKGLISRTIAVHVRYKPLYISLQFSAKQQREMPSFAYFGEPRSRRQIFWIFLWN